ncbi:gliding motility protein GldN [Cruoricaptor ignavus]|uniref:Gliding motility protein GldN n=1 Tax=Cruoricaptor ignavus TaxID=1118202 RepID=A0A7M1T1B3_9FLAO|nr:gliding motility protein GldN [Cruoricaptor ignavus]QOR73541.1 gliding motility protein GldN [Cruoricaptor ignavus]
MKKVFLTLSLLSSLYSFAQNILNAKSPAEFREMREQNMAMKGDSAVSVKNQPLSYGFIEDKDVLKSMVVWEIIDMNDRINQPLYHNSDGIVGGSKSLYQLLLDGINNGEITEVYDDEMFTTKLTPDQISARTHSERISDWLVDKINSGEKISDEDRQAGTDRYETKTENVKLIKIKGMWYIDRRDSQMKYRLLGIAAMGQDPATMGQFGPDGQPIADRDELIDLFWVWYPDAREILANNVVFNGDNISSDITYDDILNARRFSSIIYKSSNGPGDGVIANYIPRNADEQLEEHDRIKNKILEMENEMWNY